MSILSGSRASQAMHRRSTHIGSRSPAVARTSLRAMQPHAPPALLAPAPLQQQRWASSAAPSAAHRPRLVALASADPAQAPSISDTISPLATEQGPSASARRRVLELLAQGLDAYSASDELGAAVDRLITSRTDPTPAATTFTLGQGTWEVFYAPHIANLSSALGARFQPIRYVLTGDSLFSYVRYQHPLLDQGWLNAAGAMFAKDDTVVEISFDRFWADFGDSLRTEPPPASGGAMAASIDAAIGAAGRAAFFPQFALFPVLYVDADLAVFKFPPLDSNIAVRRVSA